MTRFFAVLTAVLGLNLGAARADDADPKKLEEQMEKLMEAYNKDDAKTFYTGWAKSVESITTEQVYDALYKKTAKKDLGNYKAKTLKFHKDGSVLTGEFLVVYFDAEFEKEKSGRISVNFAKEDGKYKLMQVQMAKQK